MPDGFLIEKAGDIATLIIDRPAKRNAVTDAMWVALPDMLSGFDADPQIKVLVVTGSGDAAFCAGADIEEYRVRLGDRAWAERSRLSVGAGLEAVRAMAKPTIAAIRGACVGGGVALALACDMRIAEPGARFCVPPARLGLVYPFPDTKTLVDLVGPARAKSLLFTARTLGADEALRIGVVDEVVPAPLLAARVDELAGQIAAASQFSVRAAKRMINLIQAGLTAESAETWSLSSEALAGEDHAEGVTAFLQKRPARFTFR
jgi:enoyl-CoA hydratase/carnithine racemase